MAAARPLRMKCGDFMAISPQKCRVTEQSRSLMNMERPFYWGWCQLLRLIKFGLFAAIVPVLGGCAPDYSPNTYASSAVQQANKVEPGVVVGFREVAISASGTVGAVAGGAVGGVLGAQTGSSNVSTALGTVGGGMLGSIVGTTLEHATSDTTGWEYIVRKPNGEMLSVTQREEAPIPLGQKVLVITGAQARIIADYSVAADPTPATAKDKPEATKPEAKESADLKEKAGTTTPPPAAATGSAPTADSTPTTGGAPTATPSTVTPAPSPQSSPAPATTPAPAPATPAATTTSEPTPAVSAMPTTKSEGPDAAAPTIAWPSSKPEPAATDSGIPASPVSAAPQP
jgi:outer membrane lipoprotein SlyB